MGYGVSNQRFQQVLKYLISQGVPQKEAEERLNSLSRQRIYQLMNKLKGRCILCGKETNHTVCEDCRHKQRLRK